ncbi:MFS transporter [Pseudoxanthobacter sp.]|uniref:MFS transporter n=1 Tax=Pseudoxanthobacter sp. TaxID=1925742 RepID=UPI002FE1A21E
MRDAALSDAGGAVANVDAQNERAAEGTVFAILFAISFCHMLNDMMQSLLSSLYPIFKQSYGLDFGQIGLITFAFQMTASLLQPAIGLFADKKPMPFSLAAGMGSTLIGLLLISQATSFHSILLGACLIGFGSAVFHPESSRVARMAAGRQPGLAQAVFQVGGNFGTAIGPLLAAFIVVPRGQGSVAWFSLAAMVAIIVLSIVGRWYRHHGLNRMKAYRRRGAAHEPLPHRVVVMSICVLVLLVFSKFIYMASLSSYYTFYLIDRFHVSVEESQIYLFIFLGAVAAGTVIGGPIGDRIGRKRVIWFSILGVLPFSLALPYASLFWTAVLSVVIGFILASAFSAIIVFAQELVPGKVGMIAGLFFGLSFGLGGIGAAALGQLADHTSIEFVYGLCAWLPAIGILTVLLPNIEGTRAKAKA